MKSTSRISNPYLSRKKPSGPAPTNNATTPPSQPPRPAATAVAPHQKATMALQHPPARALSAEKAHPLATVKAPPSIKPAVATPKAAAKANTTPLYNRTALPLTASSTLRQPPKTLKSKLKQEIEALKRAKLLQKQRAEEQKRCRAYEALQKKAAGAARKEEARRSAAAAAAASSTTLKAVQLSSATVVKPMVPLSTNHDGARKVALPNTETTKIQSLSKPSDTPSANPALIQNLPDNKPSPTVATSVESSTDVSPQTALKVGESRAEPEQEVLVKDETSHPSPQSSLAGPTTEPNVQYTPVGATVSANPHVRVSSSPATAASWKPSMSRPPLTSLAATSRSPLRELATMAPLTDVQGQTISPVATAPLASKEPVANPLGSILSTPTMRQPPPPHAQYGHFAQGHSSPPLVAANQAFPSQLSAYPTPGNVAPMPYHTPAMNTWQSQPAPNPQWHNPWLSYMSMGHPMMQQSLGNPGVPNPMLTNSFGYSLPTASPYPPPYAAVASPPTQVPPAMRVPPRVPPRPPPPKVPERLAKVLDAPSPYALTHILVSEPIVLLKESPSSSFGINVGLHSESALVEPEWLAKEVRGLVTTPTKREVPSTTSAIPTPTQVASQVAATLPGVTPPQGADGTITADAKTRRRRRRHVFRVMMVVDATSQNQRGKDRPSLLKTGDIVIKIGDHPLAGRTFVEACQLFKTADGQLGDDKWIRSTITVARRRPPPAPKVQVLVPQQSIGFPPARHITDDDVAQWVFCRLRGLFKNGRLLGLPPSESEYREIHTTEGGPLAELNCTFLEEAWQKRSREIHFNMNNKALLHWKSEWQKESAAIREAYDRSYLSDAQRSRMRGATRPNNACKCQSKAHRFIDDPSCPLYSNLRNLEGMDIDTTDADTPSKPKKMRFQDRKLNAIESAFTERIVREKAEKDRENNEAAFVDRAEDIQVSVLGQAIFTPSLTAMAVSCIAALKPEFERIKERNMKDAKLKSDSAREKEVTSSQAPVEKCEDAGRNEDDDDDDDDDMPLIDLAKRSAQNMDMGRSKKPKLDTTLFDFECLARILQFISKRWGHVFREPNDVDYAWRWEIYHGQTGTSEWNTSAQNPRRSGALSYENIRFEIDDKLLSHLKFSETPGTVEQKEAAKVLLCLADSSRTGLIDELLALHSSSILRIENGVPRLSSTWYANVDVLLLEEMGACWNAEADPLGRYGIHDTIRKTLSNEWVRRENGWAFSFDPVDLVYDVEEFEMWRNAFETKHEEKADDLHGVGRFGI